jgi:hypothetical protein
VQNKESICGKRSAGADEKADLPMKRSKPTVAVTAKKPRKPVPKNGTKAAVTAKKSLKLVPKHGTKAAATPKKLLAVAPKKNSKTAATPKQRPTKSPKPALQPKKFTKGSRVSAAFGGQGGKHYPGKISKVNADGTYAVLYDDGDLDILKPRKC